MIPIVCGIGFGIVAGVVMRLVPADLGVGTTWGLAGMAPMMCAAIALAIAWGALFVIARTRRSGPRSMLLAVGLLPVAALLGAGPVAGNGNIGPDASSPERATACRTNVRRPARDTRRSYS